jgi:hypothetical protein
VLQHREAWNKVSEILQSKADVSSFCLELQKQLGMEYRAPSLPVNLAMSAPFGKSKDTVASGDDEKGSSKSPLSPMSGNKYLDDNILAIANMFESKKLK